MELSLERVADAVMALRVDLRDRPDLERRQLPRFPVWAPTMLRPVGDGWGPGAGATSPFEVWLIDIACGGLGVVSKVPLTVTAPPLWITPLPAWVVRRVAPALMLT